ncbi:hypothetical protein DFQ28_011172 [Apophysomyces sp. BC1034]|nr:hypothetical protein DFQ30_008405 [Apophysomyces sp. BC1015]KAG0182647.1 hypothetical protein DFQ29_002979 [Apophysomyces sp. BC1021]KAG0191697.1 hypothetical protein DFQ28_011172 [Apophysomyces sp. BC1034]
MSEEEQKDKQNLQHQVQDLNFSIQDILSDHGPLASNDSSFQSIVQTITNEEHDPQSFAHLPAELQQLFGSNATEDLLAPASSAGPDASIALSQEHVGDIVQMWSTEAKQSDNNAATPASTSNDTASLHLTTTAVVTTPMTAPSAASSPGTHLMTSQTSSPIQHIPTPPPNQLQTSVNLPTSNHQQSAPMPVSVQTSATSTTLLDNITSQLPPDRKERFIELFGELQKNAVSADEFMAQAKILLAQQQYKQLEDLKNKPSAQQGTSRPQSVTPMMAHDQGDKKRVLTSSQVRAEDAQRAMTGMMWVKRTKTEHIPSNMSVAQSSLAPIFKTPAMPGGASLQIPRSAALPNTSMRPSTSTPTTSSGPSAGPGGDRIDYDTLTDVMGYAGVDLKEEAEHFIKDGETPGGVLPDGVDRSKTQDFMNPGMLRDTVLKLAKPLTISKIDPDFLSYLALATQDRLSNLIGQMVTASKHRVMSQSFDQPPVDDNGHPLYKIVLQQDIKKQLLAIERVEREEERKRKEIIAERERRAQMGDTEGGAGGDEDKPKKKKKDKEMGPGVTARNMSEDIRKKHTNETALMSAGGVRKSWMMTGMAKDQNAAAANRASPAPAVSPPPAGTPSAAGGNADQSADDMPRGRGRPRGRKGADAMFGKRGRGRGITTAGRPDSGRQDGGGGVGLFLPPSTIGRPRLGEQGSRKITVRDAIFALERDSQGGRGSGQRTLLKTYNQWLK